MAFDVSFEEFKEPAGLDVMARRRRAIDNLFRRDRTAAKHANAIDVGRNERDRFSIWLLRGCLLTPFTGWCPCVMSCTIGPPFRVAANSSVSRSRKAARATSTWRASPVR